MVFVIKPPAARLAPFHKLKSTLKLLLVRIERVIRSQNPIIACVPASICSAYANVSEQMSGTQGEYPQGLLVSFLATVCCALLVTMVICYYRMQ